MTLAIKIKIIELKQLDVADEVSTELVSATVRRLRYRFDQGNYNEPDPKQGSAGQGAVRGSSRPEVHHGPAEGYSDLTRSRSANDSVHSSEPNRGLGVFSVHPALYDGPARFPCSLPFGSVLVRLMDEPCQCLLCGADDNANAAVSQHKGLFPSVYQHGRSPIMRGYRGIGHPLRLPIDG